MVGEASVIKINEATTTKADEAEAVKAVDGAALVDMKKMAVEVASTSPWMKDQLGGS
jgi:isopentenyldiphosphate isomerase